MFHHFHFFILKNNELKTIYNNIYHINDMNLIKHINKKCKILNRKEKLNKIEKLN
jgi:hypothetical protein